MTLEGKTALVTGGRGGIGRAIVARFVREGATVYAADLNPAGSGVEPATQGQFLELDVAAEESVAAAMATVSQEEWNHCFAVNITGTFLTS